MEQIDLWQPVFGRSYDSNARFEEDMLNTYQKKMARLSPSR
jgi:spore photoproduct lyase